MVFYNKIIKRKPTPMRRNLIMAKLTKNEKKSIEKSMAVAVDRGPVWNSRPTVFVDKRHSCSRRNGKMECLKALRGGDMK